MELYQQGLGEYARRFWQHYGHIENCPDCASELRVINAQTEKIYGRENFTDKEVVTNRTAFLTKECTSCGSRAREIYPLEV